MADEKDRLGDKLHDAAKAREDQWAREEDERLIQRQRAKMTKEKQAGASLQCPQCGKSLVAKTLGDLVSGLASGLAMMACPDNHGAWLDADALKHIERAGK